MLILITGAGRGIGHGIAKYLLSIGHHVALGYHQSALEAQKLAVLYPEHAFALKLDVGDQDSIMQGIKTIESHFDAPILGLINNAGIAQEKDFLSITSDDWDLMMRVNLKSNFLLAQALLPNMIKQKFGRIIQISSIGGQTGGVFQPHYAAAKAGQINLTRSLARLYSDQGISANAIAIGLIETDMTKSEMAKPNFKDRLAMIPAKRLGEVSELVSLIEFLLKDEAGYLTGQTLNFNGGLYFGN